MMCGAGAFPDYRKRKRCVAMELGLDSGNHAQTILLTPKLYTSKQTISYNLLRVSVLNLFLASHAPMLNVQTTRPLSSTKGVI
ncbi:hypothetical protein ACHAWO_009388 [Cyclotella atomus]|uniref:Uncharacterized protein n=2 Tax=Cyclotella atomus TaxID=382360 RepID=A0ABD3NLE8_9STRA